MWHTKFPKFEISTELNDTYFTSQILVCCMINISNMFLRQYWRLETSSRPFYDFIKMTT